MPFFTSNGANIHIDVAGNGSAVVFVHGATLDHRQWTPQREALAGTHRMLRLDVRGHGRSASAVHGHGWDRLAEDAQRAMVQSGMQRLERGFLVGHSMSADAVLQCALAEPRLLKGVVVVAPFVWGMEFSDSWKSMMREVRQHARDGRLEAALDVFRADEIFRGVRANAELDAHVRAMQNGFSGDLWRSHERAEGTPTLERLADCNVPILVVRPEHDRDDFKNGAREIATRAPRAHVVEIDGAGHFANLESPDAFNRVLIDFLNENDA